MSAPVSPSPYEYYDQKGNIQSSPLWAASCAVAPWAAHSASTATTLFYSLAVGILILGGYFLIKAKKEADRLIAEGNKKVPSTPAGNGANMLWLVANITFNVGIAFIIGGYEKANFDATETGVVLNSISYFGQLKNTFNFLEDGMLVKLAAALGAGHIEKATSLLNWGLIGGASSGVVLSAVSYGVTFSPDAYGFFIPPINDMDTVGLEYWNLNSFAWPAYCVQIVIIGSLIAAGNSKEWFIATFIAGILNITFFYATDKVLSNLGSLAAATLISFYAFVMVIAFRFRRKPFFTSENGATPSSLPLLGKESKDIGYGALVEAFWLFVMEMCWSVQAVATTVLMTQLGIGTEMRLVLFKTIESTYGILPGAIVGSVFSICLGFTIKVGGARMIGEKQRLAFVWLSWFCIKGAVLFATLGVALLYFYSSSIPYVTAGTSACQLNTNPFTSPIYGGIFGDGFETAYMINTINVGVDVILFQLVATLYALLDLKFLGYATLFNFIAVYGPINLALYLTESTTPIYFQLASCIPNLTLAIIFAFRIRSQVKSFIRMEGELNVPLVGTTPRSTFSTPRSTTDNSEITPRTAHLLR